MEGQAQGVWGGPGFHVVKHGSSVDRIGGFAFGCLGLVWCWLGQVHDRWGLGWAGFG